MATKTGRFLVNKIEVLNEIELPVGAEITCFDSWPIPGTTKKELGFYARFDTEAETEVKKIVIFRTGVPMDSIKNCEFKQYPAIYDENGYGYHPVVIIREGLNQG